MATSIFENPNPKLVLDVSSGSNAAMDTLTAKLKEVVEGVLKADRSSESRDSHRQSTERPPKK